MLMILIESLKAGSKDLSLPSGGRNMPSHLITLQKTTTTIELCEAFPELPGNQSSRQQLRHIFKYFDHFSQKIHHLQVLQEIYSIGIVWVLFFFSPLLKGSSNLRLKLKKPHPINWEKYLHSGTAEKIRSKTAWLLENWWTIVLQPPYKGISPYILLSQG